MLPMEFFARRGFAVTNAISLAMYFGMFGSVFFLSQFLQDVLGNSPLQAEVKLLAWIGATFVVAPLARIFSKRFGSRLFMAAGLALQAVALGWLASEAATHLPYTSLLAPFVLGVSVLATVFTSHGGYSSPHAFVSGLEPALWVGTAVLVVGAVLPLLLPFNTRETSLQHAAEEASTGEPAPIAEAGPLIAAPSVA